MSNNGGTGAPEDLLAWAVGLNNAHGLTHDVKKPNGWRNLGTYNRFQAEEFGRFLQRLKDTRQNPPHPCPFIGNGPPNDTKPHES